MANNKTKRKTNKRRKISLMEFKAWLEGVEELQEDDWSPSPDQWKLIREKIDKIVETAPTQEGQSRQQSAGHGENQPTIVNNNINDNPEETHPPPGPPAPGGSALPGVPPPPQVPGSVPSGPVQDMSSQAKSLLTPGGDGSTKTPDVDTTDGSYSSTFV